MRYGHITCGLALAGGLVGAISGEDVPARPGESVGKSAIASEEDAYDLVLLAPAHPVFVRVRATIDGAGLRATRAAYAQQLFGPYDKNSDGVLDREEAKLIPPLVQSANRNETVSVADSWEAIDRDPADDKVSVAELAAYIDRVFGIPFSVALKPQRATQSVDLFSLLDTNHDGRLSRGELDSARQTLHKLDLDDDETFTVDELQPFRNPLATGAEPQSSAENSDQPFLLLVGPDGIAAAAAQLVKRYAPLDSRKTPATALDRDSLGINEPTFARHDRNVDGRLDAAELAELLQTSPVQIELHLALVQTKPGKPRLTLVSDTLGAGVKGPTAATDRLSLATNGLTIEWRAQSASYKSFASDNRKFYQLRFRTADQDKNKYLDEQEFAVVGLPNVDFKSVDRNGDGMLMEDELLAYVEQEAVSSQSRVVMTVSHDGKSVFEVLDRDLDRRISRRELQQAFERLRELDRDGNGEVTSVELAGRYRVTLELGKPSLFNRNQGATRMDGGTAPTVNRVGSGPAWFAKMDRNRDGDVSFREFLGPLAAFKKLDTNGDGLISAAEAEEAEVRK